MLADALLALGLLATSAMQLRVEDSPVGAGEICLALWLVIRLISELYKPNRLTWPFFHLLGFWILFAVAQGIGALMSLMAEAIRDPFSSKHDTIAYFLVAGVSCLGVMQADAPKRLRRSAWVLASVGSVCFSILLVDAQGGIDIPFIEPWYYNRFIGWADNANMFALTSAVLAGTAIYLAETATGTVERLLAIACSIVPIISGILTRSDSFTLFLLVTGPILIGLKFRTWLTAIRGSPMLPTLACVTILTVPLMLLSLVPLTPAIIVSMEHAAEDTYDEGGQGEHRLNLWREGFNRGVDSGMLGFGPGAHLVKTKFKRAPPPNFEAHNTIIDIFSQGGALAVLSLAWLSAASVWVTYRERKDTLTAVLFGLAIFSMFHLVVRHPVFWFVTALCFATTMERKEEREGERSSLAAGT